MEKFATCKQNIDTETLRWLWEVNTEDDKDLEEMYYETFCGRPLFCDFNISFEDWERLTTAQNETCWLCDVKGYCMVPEHNHETGEFYGLVCPECSISIQELKDMEFNREPSPSKIIRALLDRKAHES